MIASYCNFSIQLILNVKIHLQKIPYLAKNLSDSSLIFKFYQNYDYQDQIILEDKNNFF